MKEVIYKSLIVSLVITNVWSVYMFLDFYNEGEGLFHGFGTLVKFLWTCWISAGVGGIIILTSVLRSWNSISQKVFSLAIVASLNAFFFIVFIVLCIERIVSIGGLWEMFLVANALIFILALLAARKARKLI